MEGLLIENKRLKEFNGSLYFVSVNSSVLEFMEKVHFIDDIGRENFFEIKEQAINMIFDRLDRSKCEKCQALIFNECQ